MAELIQSERNRRLGVSVNTDAFEHDDAVNTNGRDQKMAELIQSERNRREIQHRLIEEDIIPALLDHDNSNNENAVGDGGGHRVKTEEHDRIFERIAQQERSTPLPSERRFTR
eukprot:scaffold51333_cov20-Cyclotella_meneghiniana.AAC.1